MATRAYVGCADPDNPNMLHVRFVLYGGEPAEMLIVLAQLRRLTFAGDTTTALAAILAHEWTYLSAGVTAGRTDMPGDVAIPGVGMAMTEDCVTTVEADNAVADTQAGPAGVTFAALADSDAEWVYLIDPHKQTLGVYTTSGNRITVQPISG